MTGIKQKSTRRAFFLQGGAVVSAGVATAVGAAAALPDDRLTQLKTQPGSVADREAIRQLHLAFTSLIEQQSYDAAAELFTADAQLQLSGADAVGRSAIQRLFATEYREQKGAAFHGAYRQAAVHMNDVVNVSEDGRQAVATFHVEAEICTPLQDTCTVAQMARMQGHVADRRWEAGRFEAKYVKASGQWKVASLTYLSS